MKSFCSKVVVITGAASGIGAALARKLAGYQARLVLIDIDRTGLQAVESDVVRLGSTAAAHCCSVCNYAEVERAVDHTISEFGGIDIFFNNAGRAIVGEARHYALQDWFHVLDVNLNGVVHGVQAVYPKMVEQRHGHIVNMASIGGLVAFPFGVSYATSKFAVVGLTRSLYYEGKRHNVMVSMACPAYVYTPILENARMVKFDRQKTVRIEERFFGMEKMTPEKCASIILNGVAAKKREILPSPYARLLNFTQRYFPGLIDIMMKFGAWQMRKAAMD